jgi:hypothetical protein
LSEGNGGDASLVAVERGLVEGPHERLARAGRDEGILEPHHTLHRRRHEA